MWNNWVGQLQDTLGEAVEYLRENEEGDEEEEEEEIAEYVPQNEHSARTLVAPARADAVEMQNKGATLSLVLPSTSFSNADVKLAETPATAVASSATLPRDAVTTAGTSGESMAPAPDDGDDVDASPDLPPETSVHAEVNVTTSGISTVAEKDNTSTATREVSDDAKRAPAVVATSSSVVIPAAPVEKLRDRQGDASPALSSTAPETATSVVAAAPPLASPHSPSTSPMAPNTGDTGRTQQEPQRPLAQPHSPPAASVSLSSAVAQNFDAASSDVTQLLRFQQQLAEEMERASELETANGNLRVQVKSLSAELEAAKTQLASSASSADDVATLIEKLGRERERNKSVLIERNKLMEQVSVLEEEVADYRSRSADLDRIVQEQEVSREHINKLETEKEQFVTQMVALREELQSVKEAKESLSRQLNEFEKTHDSAVSQMKESTSSELEYATREIERLKGAVRTATVEYEDHITELENELSQANRRVHMAESRLNDMERSAVESSQDLRRQLADLQQQTSVLTGELGATRHAYEELQSKHTALQRERNISSERQPEESAALRAAKDHCMTLEEHVSSLKQELINTQRELESTRWQVDSLKASNTHLSASLEKARQGTAATRGPAESAITTPLEKSLSLSAAPHNLAFSPAPGSSSSYASIPAVAATLPVPNPFLPTHRAPLEGPLDGKVRGRLEKEVLRQTMEIGRLRQVEAEHTKLRQSFEALQVEHDLVLQMYGQVVEELQTVRASGHTKEQDAPATAAPAAVDANSTPKPPLPPVTAAEIEVKGPTANELAQ